MNPRIHYWLLFCMLMYAGMAHAQYNPSNPPEPAVYFTLSLQATPASTCTFNISTPASYESGKSVRLNATAAKNYRFVAWVEGDVALSTSAQFDYTMPSRNVTLTAQLEYSPSSPSEPPVPQPDTATTAILYLSCSPAESGSINIASGKEYAIGASVTLKATAKTNYTFVNWTSDDQVISTTAQFSYKVQRAGNNLVANFAYSPSNPSEPPVIVPSYPLTIERTPSAGGTVNISSGNYAKDAVINLTATPKSGYLFVHWLSGDEVLSESASFSYVMPALAVTITAVFATIYNPSNPSEPSTCLLGSGSCGTNLTWTLTCDNVLTIRGAGEMTDYDISENVVPWNEYKHAIRVVILPDGLTSIGKLAFGNFARLGSIRIPEQVSQIGDSAFFRCRRLASIYSKAQTPPTIGQNAFEAVNKLIPLVVPQNKKGIYSKATGWRDFLCIHEEPYDPSVVNIFGEEIVVIETIDTLTTVFENVDMFDNATMVYNTVDNSLVLNSLILNADDNLSTAISYSGSEPLTIVLNDTSTIIADTVIASTGDIIIVGEGKLEAEGVVPIIGAADASITFDSVSMHVRSLPSSAAVRKRISGAKFGKRVDETGGPALSGFSSADFDKVNVTPPDAVYGAITTTDPVSGDERIIQALYLSNEIGELVAVTEFILSPKEEINTAIRQTQGEANFDPSQPMYNILGVQVDASYRGVVIQDGQKYLLR